jgi:gas vesicle protein
MAKKNSESVPGWVIAGAVVALAAAVIGLTARNAKGKKQYDQLVAAIQDLIEEGRTRAENAADVLTDTGHDLAKDVQRRARKAKRRLG